jgi:hypothetical protein
MRNAFFTCSALARPDQEIGGEPPANDDVMVAIARPAPFSLQPPCISLM